MLKIQKDLGLLGHVVPQTGYYGHVTQQAVIKFQKASRLKADGIVGERTWKALESAVAGKKNISSTPRAEGVYIVQKGDTIVSIAAKLKISADDLAAANKMTTSHPLYVGQALALPGYIKVSDVDISDLPLPISEDANQRSVTLTFDDTPSTKYMDQILEILNRYEVRATFFLTAETVTRSQKIIREAHGTGHTIQNHGTMINEGMSEASLQQAIARTAQTIESVTGKRPLFYRPLGYGSAIDICRSAATLGHKIAMWTNIGRPDDDEFFEATKNAVFSGAVLRFSLDDPAVLDILPRLIDHIKARGFTIIPLG